MKKISVKIIPHKDQFYETCGDWFFHKDGNLGVKVSDTGDWKYNTLIALHEIIEALLCKDAGISGKEVTDFDIVFESNRELGNIDEPGDDPNAPYYLQHKFATSIEKALASALKVDWDKYNQIVVNL